MKSLRVSLLNEGRKQRVGAIRVWAVAAVWAALMVSNLAYSHVSVSWLNSNQAPSDSQSWAVSGAAGVQGVQYLYGSRISSKSEYVGVTGELRAVRETPATRFVGQFEGMGVVNAQTGYYEFPELWLGSRPGRGIVDLSLGRKSIPWSRMDRAWSMGLWQPRFRWDYVRPREVGLTGVFVEKSWETGRFTLFGSGLFIPERGVPIEVQGGKLVSNSPFFVPPMGEVLLNGKSLPVEYQLNIPELEKIVIKPSLGLKMDFGGKQGLFGSVAYAYKPMNPLLVGAEGLAQLNSSSQSAVIEINPRVIQEHVVSFESGWSGRFLNRNLQIWGSANYVFPETESVPSTWTIQQVQRAQIYGLGMSLEDSETHASLSASLMKLVGGNQSDAGLDATPGSTFFEPRYPYSLAARLGMTSPVWSGFQLNAGMTYDWDALGGIWSIGSRYFIGSIGLNLGADFIGTRRNIQESSFISRYRSNDRIYAGVSYVF